MNSYDQAKDLFNRLSNGKSDFGRPDVATLQLIEHLFKILPDLLGAVEVLEQVQTALNPKTPSLSIKEQNDLYEIIIRRLAMLKTL